MCVLETRPGSAVSIIECDMNVEFAPPVGYKEPKREMRKEESEMEDLADLMPAQTGFVAFKGEGVRLDGKKRKDIPKQETLASKPTYVRGIPDYDYQIGTLRFLRNIKPTNNKEIKDSDEFKAFSSEGFTLLRKSRK